MSPRRGAGGRFITDEATKRVRHDIFGTASAESAWLAGLIAADGNISPDLKRVGLAQSGTRGRLLIEEARRITAHTGTVSATQPAKGNVSYGITIGSTKMIEDLRDKYGITPRKTLTYKWPPCDPSLVSPFLRGYVDGDGCVGIYPTPQGNPMLHLSFVGTPSFIQGAMAAIPAHGRCRVITRCKSLQEARYHGRHAWAAATWLYADTGLIRSAKQQAFAHYQQLLRTDPPKWHTWAIERQRILTLMKAGKTPVQIAAETGLPVSRIYNLGWQTRKAAAE
ncbi:hypothetical protein DMB66_33545 [Actinoplanes sp. ATCC 53533]|uniref:hypothetical protein n=1 Tax=Actinoplanes sp. ATCC 53533 TaxID=1288362 RepID=UPI000F794EA4|nr:hypothetical protein [Actinoplanes sp. ATCC 53533]RSM56626.1 hypothetical protein DMB66_33545 [Actinoplanes sp. ATCC 53533]